MAALADDEPAFVHVTIPARRRVSPRPGLVVHRAGDTKLRRLVGWPPRSANDDLVIDLTQTAGSERDAIAVVTAAFQRRLTTPRQLRRALDRRPKLAHRAILEALTSDDSAGVHSVLEWGYLTRVERAHGLPRGRRQVKIVSGGRVEFRDVWYEEYALGVELDGRRWHETRAFRDMARDNRAAERGETTLRYGYDGVFGQPCGAASQLARIFRARGWRDSGRRCGQACTYQPP